MKCEKCGSECLVPITQYLNLCLNCGHEMENDEELRKHIEKVKELANKVKGIVNELKEDKGIDIINMFK